MQRTDVIQVIGGFGIYHGIILLVSCLRAIPMSWTNTMAPLMAADVAHWCASPNSTIPSDWWKQNGVPVDNSNNNNNGQLAECRMYSWTADSSSEFGIEIDRNHTTACTHGWHYQRDGFGLTATESWNLVCGSAWKGSLMQSVIMAGQMAGCAVSGRISDRFGRKSTFLVGLLVMMATSVAAAYAPTFAAFNALRFVLSASGISMSTAIGANFIEILPENDRIHLIVGFGVSYAASGMLVPLLSYHLQDFRDMQLAVAMACTLILPFCWAIRESPKWLLAKQQIDRTEQVIVGILRTNRRPIPDMKLIMPKLAASAQTEAASRSRNLGLVDIVKLPVLRRNALILGVLWFASSTVHYYLIINAHRLPGDPHLNSAISSSADLPSALIAMYLLRNYRRRPAQILPAALGTTLFAGVALFDSGYSSVKVWGTWLVRICICTVTYVEWVAVYEIYPTTVRATGFCLTMMLSRAGGMLAPFLKDIGDNTHPMVPSFVFISLCCVIIVCVRLLPETYKVQLPDTVDDIKDMCKVVDRQGRTDEKRVIALTPGGEDDYC